VHETAENKRNCAVCQRLRTFGRRLFTKLLRGYDFVMARPGMAKVNGALLSLALRGLGYNHCCDPEYTGEMRLIRRIGKLEPSFCIDVGANVGTYTRTILEETSAAVLAFEPLPGAFAKLEAVAREHPGRVTAINCGVGNVSGDLLLHFGDDESELASFSPVVSSIPYVSASCNRSQKVRIVTLDEYLLASGNRPACDRIDLLKIDVEGFEHEVLLGARRTIEELRPRVIQLEYNWHQLFTGHTLLDLARLLPGYDAFQLLPFGSGLRPVDITSPRSNVFEYANFAFVAPQFRI